MATAQWVIGPIIDYNTIVEHFKYFMSLNEEEYMKNVVPLLFTLNNLHT